MSFGQPPICDSECINCQKEPGVRPSLGGKPQVPPKPARLKSQPAPAQPLTLRPPIPPQSRSLRPPVPKQGVVSKPAPNRPLSLRPLDTRRPSAQPQPVPAQADVFRAPFSPHMPSREVEQYSEYMRSRAPSQGDGEMNFIEPAAVPPKRRVPPRKSKGPYTIDPITRRRVFRPADSSVSSPHTPPREDEQYTEYMRSRAPSQEDGEMEARTVPPITRKRLHGIIDSQDSLPLSQTVRVHTVTTRNFDEVIKSMEKAFVLFYDQMSENSKCAGDELARAAVREHPPNHAFAAVDCTREQELCAREDATRLPIFKLYSNGFDLSTIRDVNKFCADNIHKLMKGTPVLTQPRTNLTRGYMQGR